MADYDNTSEINQSHAGIAVALSAYNAIKTGVEKGDITATSETRIGPNDGTISVNHLNINGNEYFNASRERDGVPYNQKTLETFELDTEDPTIYDATSDFIDSMGDVTLGHLKGFYEASKNNTAEGTTPLTPYSFFSEVCPEYMDNIQTLFTDSREDHKTFDIEKFNKYIDARDRDIEVKNNILWKTGLIGFSALLVSAATSTPAAAIEAPNIYDTKIYDSNDERASMGGGPSSSADYENLASGTNLPITVEGYGLNSENHFDVYVLYPNGTEAWRGAFIPNGVDLQEINAMIPANAPDGTYIIGMDLDQSATSCYDEDVDEFGLVTTTTTEVPEFPTIALPIAAIFAILGLGTYNRKE